MEGRIKILKQDNVLEIIINAFCDQKKQTMLMIWIILFSLCGFAIISQFFGNYEPGVKVFFGVYVAFWLFFEFKVIYAYRWRKLGKEVIVIDNDELKLIKTIGKRGITQIFSFEEIKKIDYYKDQNGNFAKSMNTSYWNINKYSLALNLENEVVPFAIDLPKNDAKKILNEIRGAIQKSS